MTKQTDNSSDKVWKDVGHGVGSVEKTVKKTLKKLEKGIPLNKEEKSSFLYDVLFESGTLVKKIREKSNKLEKEIFGK